MLILSSSLLYLDFSFPNSVSAQSTVAVFDAGSTGTRLNMYTFEKDKLINTKTYKKSYEKSRGIHLLNEKETKDELLELIKQSDLKIDRMGFYGTGGMRSLPKNNVDEKLKQIKEHLNQYNLVELSVLSGEEEAFYVMKAFEVLNPEYKKYTLIDMGGSSVQIVSRDNNTIKLASMKMGMSNRKCLINIGEISSSKNGRNRIEVTEKTIMDNPGIEKLIGNEITKSDMNLKKKSTFIADLNIKILECVVLNEQLSCKSIYSSGLQEDKTNITELNKSMLTQTEQNDKECIVNFFKMGQIQKIKTASNVFLISAFEYAIPDTHAFTLQQLYEYNINNCQNTFTNQCSEMFFSQKFLEAIGIEADAILKIPNKKSPVLISWPFGKAFELNKKSI